MSCKETGRITISLLEINMDTERMSIEHIERDVHALIKHSLFIYEDALRLFSSIKESNVSYEVENGEIYSVASDRTRDGPYVQYWENNKPFRIGNFTNGKENGVRHVFTQRGQLRRLKTIVDGDEGKGWDASFSMEGQPLWLWSGESGEHFYEYHDGKYVKTPFLMSKYSQNNWK